MIVPLLALALGKGAAPALQTFLRSDANINGVTTTRDGRVFVCYPDAKPGQIRAAEIRGKDPVPFPPGGWNLWTPGKDASKGFVFVNSLRVGPDGDLYLVDVGAKGIGKPVIPGGPKLVRVDLATNAVKRVYPVGALKPRSGIDDVRFQGREAVFTDAGEPGLIVMDLDSGACRRVLDGHPSTTQRRPLRAEGKVLKDPRGKDVKIHADQMEFSPDGRWFYYQPCSGPMSKIEARYLGADFTDAERAKRVLPFLPTRTTGGTCIDAQGNVYVSDVEGYRIVRYTPAGKMSVVVQDSGRLIWPDALWITDGGDLIVPAPQQNRTAMMNRGKERTVFPTRVFRLALGLKPFRS